MKIANLLHFYQPYNQQIDILDRIVNECYRPVIKGLLEKPNRKIVVNISGVLTKLLHENGYSDVIEGLVELAVNKQIEFTSSAMYHAFLPLLPESEIERQILINNETNSKYFGKFYSPTGFFSPEMAVNNKVLHIISKMGYKWIAVSESADMGEHCSKLYIDKVNDITVFFRNKRVSSLILSAVVRKEAELVIETLDLNYCSYFFTVMDAETFGHHRIGHEKMLFGMLDSEFYEPCLAQDLMKLELPVEEVSVRPSTWTNEEQDFWLDKERTNYTEARSFNLWNDPKNPIHELQWKFINMCLDEISSFKGKKASNWIKARNILDYALSSDQFWWASAKPWWSLEMVEQGAFEMKNVITALYKIGSDPDPILKADNLYRKILDQAFEWQRTGYIRKKHLENSSTYMKEPFKERAPREWYNQMVLEFEDEMNKASEKKDFEKAIKWRDALIKLKNGNDIYDVLHVVDELWSARNIPSVRPFLQHKPNEISDFAREFLQRSDPGRIPACAGR